MDNDTDFDMSKIQITGERLIHEVRRCIENAYTPREISALCETLYQLGSYIRRKRAEQSPELPIRQFMLQGFARYIRSRCIDIDYVNEHGDNPLIKGKDNHKYGNIIAQWVQSMLLDACKAKLDDFETTLLEGSLE